MTDSLTAKQKAFCDEYLVDLNAAQAAIRAGYSEKTAKEIGHENLTKPHLVRYIQARMTARAERTEVDQDYVIRTIVDTIERCKQAKPVRDGQGNPVMVETEDGDLAAAFRYEPAAVLKGAELLGRHLKMFTDKIDLGGGLKLSHEDALDALK